MAGTQMCVLFPWFACFPGAVLLGLEGNAHPG